MSDGAVLLDTRAWWGFVMGSERLGGSASLALIRSALKGQRAFVSILSVWELGRLEARGRIRFHQGLKNWVERALSTPGIRLQGLTPSIAIESTRLPDGFHGDPMYRVLLATARELDIPIVTADPAILAYADLAQVKAVPV